MLQIHGFDRGAFSKKGFCITYLLSELTLEKVPNIINNISWGMALEVFCINHCMRNLFTTETLSQLLEEKGFKIKESYYFDEFYNMNIEEGFRCVVSATRD